MAERFRAAIDGGSRGNPGPAAWGVAVLDAAGTLVEGHGGYVGHATNNVAEYQALLEALKLATEREASDVEIRADSELVVRQITGVYRVRHPQLKPLYAEARRLIGGFDTPNLGNNFEQFVEDQLALRGDRLRELAQQEGWADRPSPSIR